MEIIGSKEVFKKYWRFSVIYIGVLLLLIAVNMYLTVTDYFPKSCETYFKR